MKQVAGFWLPDSERHLVPVLEKSAQFWKGPTYQVDKFLACLPHIKRFQHGLDIGAHCGLWSRVMAKCFSRLTAFEPMPQHIECWRKNIRDVNTTLHEIALGDEAGELLMMAEPESTGDSCVSNKGSVRVLVDILDAIKLEAVDFMKIDAEGFELFILDGGKETIRRDRPCIMVEQKPGRGKTYGLGDTAAVDLLKSWGASLRFVQSSDYCLSWD